MGYLDALLYGVRTLLQQSTEKPLRSRASFGRGFTLTDDPINDWTLIDLAAEGAQGNANAAFNNTASVVKWAPANVSSVYGYTVAGFTSTTTATGVDLLPYLGAPTAVVIDDASFVAFAAAIVTARKGASDWAMYRVSRAFTRHSSGAVAAGAATSDDGKDRQGTASSTPWPVPTLSWNTTTKFPKLSVDSDEAATVNWRATMTVVVHTG